MAVKDAVERKTATEEVARIMGHSHNYAAIPYVERWEAISKGNRANKQNRRAGDNTLDAPVTPRPKGETAVLQCKEHPRTKDRGIPLL